MKTFTLSETREPGTYKPCRTGSGRKTAFIVCPDCERRIHLNPHVVSDDGAVTPSVVCGGPCAFHEFVRLEGWTA
ncbi:hypothetical protein MishRS11D_25210 [Methylomagnum ishizawai]|nr:hypothetical protein MishRS11D_25210 [Methylomagnum ishizawai]